MLAPKGRRPRLLILILILVEICLKNDAIHDFTVWLRTASNPGDINRFRSHTGYLIPINSPKRNSFEKNC